MCSEETTCVCVCVAGEVVDRMRSKEKRRGQRLTLWDARAEYFGHNGFTWCANGRAETVWQVIRPNGPLYVTNRRFFFFF